MSSHTYMNFTNNITPKQSLKNLKYQKISADWPYTIATCLLVSLLTVKQNKVYNDPMIYFLVETDVDYNKMY